jgi:hypothetical protein
MKNNSWAAIEIKRTKKEFPKKWGKITKQVLIDALAGRLAKLRRENNKLKKLVS